jgi:hypothetical protein
MVESMKHGSSGCVVCGSTDSRSMSTTTLDGGGQVDVCASHALAYFRAGRGARNIKDLVTMTAERRKRTERRDSTQDELARVLEDAFAPKPPRTTGRRKTDAAC